MELTITGKLRGDDVTHTVSFSGAEQRVSSDSSQPIHRLCAKAQIKQLEEEEELEGSRGRMIGTCKHGNVH